MSTISIASGLICAALAGGIILVIHAFRNRGYKPSPIEPVLCSPMLQHEPYPVPVIETPVPEYIPMELLLKDSVELPKKVEFFLAQLPESTSRMVARHRMPMYLYPQVVEFVEQMRADILSGKTQIDKVLPRIDMFIRRKINEHNGIRPSR